MKDPLFVRYLKNLSEFITYTYYSYLTAVSENKIRKSISIPMYDKSHV